MHLVVELLGKTKSFYFLHVSSRCGDSPTSCKNSLIGLACSCVSLDFPILLQETLSLFLIGTFMG